MRESGLLTWLMLLLAQSRTTVTIAMEGDLGLTEVVVPGTGHVQDLPHSLRPALHEIRPILYYHRKPQRSMRDASHHPVVQDTSASSDKLVFGADFIKAVGTLTDRSSRSKRYATLPFPLSSLNHFLLHRHDAKMQHMSFEKDPHKWIDLFSRLQNPVIPKRQKREDKNTTVISATNSSHVQAENHLNNSAPNVDGDDRRRLSDKEIYIIVVCSSVGLVVCLLGAALLAKGNVTAGTSSPSELTSPGRYWNKMRDAGAGGYHGVLQKDTSEGNSPTDESIGMQSSSKKDIKDSRAHTNMFAQIDEIDEEGVPSPTTGRTRRLSSLNRSQCDSGGETKPLLTHTSPTHQANLTSKADTKRSESKLINGRAIGISENEKENDPEVCVDVDTGNAQRQALPSPSAASRGTTAQVHVEVNNSNTEPEKQSLLEASEGVVEEPEDRLYCRTGLSQSDYSISSFTSINPSYRYGNQVGYMGGYYGYPCSGDDLTSPESPGDADDRLLLPPPRGFDAALNLSVVIGDPERLQNIAAIADEGDLVAPPSPLDADSVLVAPPSPPSAEGSFVAPPSPPGAGGDLLSISSTYGQLTEPLSIASMDNGSEFSLKVNVDDGDLAECREACDLMDEQQPTSPTHKNGSPSVEAAKINEVVTTTGSGTHSHSKEGDSSVVLA